MNSNTGAPVTNAWEAYDDDLEQRTSPATAEDLARIEKALGMQMVSMRMHKELVEQLKLIANHHGVGYQPLIRDVLRRFSAHEIHRIAAELDESRKQFEAMKPAHQQQPATEGWMEERRACA